MYVLSLEQARCLKQSSLVTNVNVQVLAVLETGSNYSFRIFTLASVYYLESVVILVHSTCM